MPDRPAAVPPRHVNDKTAAPPRLAVYGNVWGMLELPRRPHTGPDWSFEECCDKLKAAGFDGMQAHVGQEKIVTSRGLRFATSGRCNTPAEVAEHARAAAGAGADGTTLHVGWGWEDDAEIDALVDAVLEASAHHELPMYVETHRATIAQDLWRITQLIARRPAVRFNGDFSHLYCGNELTYPGFDVIWPRLEPILRRVCFLHGRISNAESMQIDVGDGRTNVHAKNFCRLWTAAMKYWLTDAKPGDLFPFTPELGPPSSGYSITYADLAGQVIEVSDRWAQTLVFRDLARDCWAEAQAGK